MRITHHLTDETIQDYASGSLTASMETVIACHLTVCSHCRSRAAFGDELGGSLFDEGEPATVSSTASELLAKAAMMPAHSAPRGPELSEGVAAVDGVPKPLGRLLPNSFNELDWRRIAPGIKQHNLSDQHRRYGAFQLLQLEPGVKLSAHTHNDRELTYLVQGSYIDEIGHFQKGDIADLDGHENEHQPVINSEIPCIALIATHSPVNYSGVLGKIMQPFVGI